MSGPGALLEAPTYPALERVHRLSAAGSELGRQLERGLDVPPRMYRGSIVPASVCEHLLHVPVIQQADHSNLLLDAETFLHNYPGRRPRRDHLAVLDEDPALATHLVGIDEAVVSECVALHLAECRLGGSPESLTVNRATPARPRGRLPGPAGRGDDRQPALPGTESHPCSPPATT